ncbi:MAG: hypothetical protein KDD73_10835 [Anaerolineales bacterium]|nr:hypothetical protein [Anaerolineales bacterium]MCB9128135.1 hypothetical protein [Ardenticatenales bacterium]MCB9171845.1 hypothetical protein [Ardenticatenales bacterium]
MPTYTERVQTVLTKKQYDQLREVAEYEQRPLSVMIREAIVAQYLAKIETDARHEALANLLALDAPIADWPQIEAEIEQGALDG